MTNYIVAESYLCFMALLEMIALETTPDNHLTQYDFAELFGITVPVGTKTPIKNVQYSANIEDFGTNICVKEINKFFEKNMIPLQLSFISSCYFDEITFADTIQKNGGEYMVFAFCYGLLYNEPQNNDIGHVVLLEKIDTGTDTIQIYDPGPRNHGSKTVKVDDMVYAMKRRGGIYLFEKVDH